MKIIRKKEAIRFSFWKSLKTIDGREIKIIYISIPTIKVIFTVVDLVYSNGFFVLRLFRFGLIRALFGVWTILWISKEGTKRNTIINLFYINIHLYSFVNSYLYYFVNSCKIKK